MAMHSSTDITGAPADDTPVVVPTTDGALRGGWHDGVARFAGVPFAAPPVGPRRFRPPAPVEPWDGERDATAFGPISPQNPSLMDALFGGEAETVGRGLPLPQRVDPGPAGARRRRRRDCR